MPFFRYLRDTKDSDLVVLFGENAAASLGLLVGEGADPEIEAAARAVADEHPDILEVLHVITLQQGPGEVVLAAKIRVTPEVTAEGVCEAIDAFEVAVKQRCPEVRWSFIEPDLHA